MGSLLPVALLGLGILLQLAGCSPPPDPVVCTHGTSNCTITNTYGFFLCPAANVTYPRTEQELVAAVAAVASAKRKVKVATKHSHSIPKLACPGGRDGTIISTARLNRTVRVDAEKRLMTVESGMLLRDLIEAAAAEGLSLPHSPYWSGLTIGGLLATGAHGSSLWGKGGAVHEYVVGLRIVTPAPAGRGFAVVRELGAHHPDLDATKVSIGVLGVISQGKVVYRQDDRVDVSTPGDGLNDMLLFRANPTRATIAARAAEELLQENGTDTARCAAARLQADTLERLAYGFTNDGVSFTGYPVASGTCADSPEDGLRSACGWDPRIPGSFNDNSGFSVALSKAPAFIVDMQRLRDLNPAVFCAGVDPRIGVAFRYIKASSAYLGKAEDSIAIDIIYYRSHADGMPRVHADVVDEIEQMALHKYGALPHWGKNRNIAFDGAISKYPKAHEFLMVKDRYDPDGLFSSEWSDQVLGVNESPNIMKEHCAIEGNCVCSEDSHCAPEQGYFCRPGKVYAKARVCSFGKDD
ncbi:hypothetical protein CFC21_099305 [Triticum aestivum]|uniref:FAD-binding PCMH-type domain-containing protein n=2 Tax=Triticum aestivum TaxID=4565 RepID=A0A9R1LYP0_WHEAT|nr:hypothetical protein CFC21_099305 [Triticum aestivum]